MTLDEARTDLGGAGPTPGPGPHEPAWYRFVERVIPRRLALFGSPLPGHPYWTPEALAATAQRYPNLDLSPWR